MEMIATVNLLVELLVTGLFTALFLVLFARLGILPMALLLTLNDKDIEEESDNTPY